MILTEFSIWVLSLAGGDISIIAGCRPIMARESLKTTVYIILLTLNMSSSVCVVTDDQVVRAGVSVT